MNADQELRLAMLMLVVEEFDGDHKDMVHAACDFVDFVTHGIAPAADDDEDDGNKCEATHGDKCDEGVFG